MGELNVNVSSESLVSTAIGCLNYSVAKKGFIWIPLRTHGWFFVFWLNENRCICISLIFTSFSFEKVSSSSKKFNCLLLALYGKAGAFYSQPLTIRLCIFFASDFQQSKSEVEKKLDLPNTDKTSSKRTQTFQLKKVKREKQQPIETDTY